MDTTDATDFRITEGEEPADADGIVTAWINFDTAVGRGSGLLRLNDEGAWTLLTTLDELKGHEEPPRRHPAQGSNTWRCCLLLRRSC